MAYGNILATPNIKLIPAQTRAPKALDFSTFMQHLYTAFAVGFAIALICMALRLIFALLLVDGSVENAVVAITNPLIAPFTDVFNDGKGMIQISTMTAFTVYYLLYGVAGKYLTLFRRQLSPTA